MATRNPLLSRLAQSLDNAIKREIPAAPAPTAAKRKATAPRPKAPRPTAGGKCAKLSISIFPADLDRLEAIRSYMAARGHRISISQTVKLALRTARLSEDMTAALDAIKAEDGRASKRNTR
jgi:hypothetical protein